jgi:hypothetical protein
MMAFLAHPCNIGTIQTIHCIILSPLWFRFTMFPHNIHYKLGFARGATHVTSYHYLSLWCKTISTSHPFPTPHLFLPPSFMPMTTFASIFKYCYFSLFHITLHSSHSSLQLSFKAIETWIYYNWDFQLWLHSKTYIWVNEKVRRMLTWMFHVPTISRKSGIMIWLRASWCGVEVVLKYLSNCQIFPHLHFPFPYMEFYSMFGFIYIPFVRSFCFGVCLRGCSYDVMKVMCSTF